MWLNFKIIPNYNSALCVRPPQYTVHTKRVPFNSDNEVSPYSLSPLSNKRYDISRMLHTGQEQLSDNRLVWYVSSLRFRSHKLLRSPRKPARKISKIPFKVLDAPELQDDFYLNLVDWSAGNLLSVGLGACVYLWSACTSQVRGQHKDSRLRFWVLLQILFWVVIWSINRKEYSVCLKRKVENEYTLCLLTGDKVMWPFSGRRLCYISLLEWEGETRLAAYSWQ